MENTFTSKLRLRPIREIFWAKPVITLLATTKALPSLNRLADASEPGNTIHADDSTF